jgi:hypothetical protein
VIDDKKSDDDDLLIRTALEQKDMVLQLFEGIPNLCVFDMGKIVSMRRSTAKNYNFNGEEYDSSSKEVYQIYNIYTNNKIASLIRITFYNAAGDKPSVILWSALVKASSFGAHVIRILNDKYPKAVSSNEMYLTHYFDNETGIVKCEEHEGLIDRNDPDSLYFDPPVDYNTPVPVRINELFGRESVSDIFREIMTVVEFANCFALYNKPVVTVENSAELDCPISTSSMESTVYLKSEDDAPNIMTIKSVSKARLSEDKEIAGIIEEYVEIQPIYHEEFTDDKNRFIHDLAQYICGFIVKKGPLCYALNEGA